MVDHSPKMLASEEKAIIIMKGGGSEILILREGWFWLMSSYCDGNIRRARFQEKKSRLKRVVFFTRTVFDGCSVVACKDNLSS